MMKTGFTCSTFDLLHAGHILMLEEARSKCDKLIVGLQTDPTIDRPTTKNKPVQSVYERYVQLRAVKFVDEIFVYATEHDLEQMLLSLPIDIRILGDEYQHKEFTGKQIRIDRGIELYFNKRLHGFSTTELRNEYLDSWIHHKTFIGALWPLKYDYATYQPRPTIKENLARQESCKSKRSLVRSKTQVHARCCISKLFDVKCRKTPR